MATAKNTSITGYCNDVYNDLSDMRKKIETLRMDARKAYGPDSPVTHEHERHLEELASMIEWKLQILMKICPFDWKGADEGVETVVSVESNEKTTGPEFSGGYVGG